MRFCGARGGEEGPIGPSVVWYLLEELGNTVLSCSGSKSGGLGYGQGRCARNDG